MVVAGQDLIDLKLWDFYYFSVVPPIKLRFFEEALFLRLKSSVICSF